MSSLPFDVLVEVMKCLDTFDILRCRRFCKIWAKAGRFAISEVTCNDPSMIGNVCQTFPNASKIRLPREVMLSSWFIDSMGRAMSARPSTSGIISIYAIGWNLKLADIDQLARHFPSLRSLEVLEIQSWDKLGLFKDLERVKVMGKVAGIECLERLCANNAKISHIESMPLRAHEQEDYVPNKFERQLAFLEKNIQLKGPNFLFWTDDLLIAVGEKGGFGIEEVLMCVAGFGVSIPSPEALSGLSNFQNLKKLRMSVKGVDLKNLEEIGKRCKNLKNVFLVDSGSPQLIAISKHSKLEEVTFSSSYFHFEDPVSIAEVAPYWKNTLKRLFARNHELLPEEADCLSSFERIEEIAVILSSRREKESLTIGIAKKLCEKLTKAKFYGNVMRSFYHLRPYFEELKKRKNFTFA